MQAHFDTASDTSTPACNGQQGRLPAHLARLAHYDAVVGRGGIDTAFGAVNLVKRGQAASLVVDSLVLRVLGLFCYPMRAVAHFVADRDCRVFDAVAGFVGAVPDGVAGFYRAVFDASSDLVHFFPHRFVRMRGCNDG